MSRRSELRNRLCGPAAEIYDYVQNRYPAYEDGFFQRRGSATDDAFRHLMRAVVEQTPRPKGWRQGIWPDQDVVELAMDPEARRRAWTLLADNAPDGWREQWIKKNSNDRRFTYVIALVGAAILVGVVVFS